MLLVAFAILFLAAVFLTKNGLPWANKAVYDKKGGAQYKDALVADLLKRDTDADGVLDWEESLLGLDPTKSETTPGTPDITVANKLRTEEGAGITGTADAAGATGEKLTETDKFSRELFSTVAALEQSGSLDQETAERMAASLAEKMQNPVQRKIFSLTDVKTTQDESLQSIEKYATVLSNIRTKFPIQNTTFSILEKFVSEENSGDSSILKELTPIVTQTQKIIGELSTMEVPQFLAFSHSNYLNALEKLAENISDIQYYDTDPILSLGAIIKYEENSALLESASAALLSAIEKKLGY